MGSASGRFVLTAVPRDRDTRALEGPMLMEGMDFMDELPAPLAPVADDLDGIALTCADDALSVVSLVMRQETRLTAAFVDYDFVLPPDAPLAALRLQLPARRAVVRVRRLELFRAAKDGYPLWRCSADTRFHGLVRPRKTRRLLVDGSLVLVTSARRRTLKVFPGSLPQQPRLLRVRLAIDDGVSESLLRSLERDTRERAVRLRRARRVRFAEAQDLAAILRQKDSRLRQLEQEVECLRNSRLWRLLAPVRGSWRGLAGLLQRLQPAERTAA